MNAEWNDDQPIYRQLRDRIVALILDSALGEGEAIPSARTVAAEYRINPLTVLKAYHQLAEEGLVENRRGIGLFVNPGARDQLLKDERRRFLQEEWPKIRARIQRLDLNADELLRGSSEAPSRSKARHR